MDAMVRSCQHTHVPLWAFLNTGTLQIQKTMAVPLDHRMCQQRYTLQNFTYIELPGLLPTCDNITMCFQNAQKNHFVKTELDSSRKNDYCRISNESDGNPSQQMLNRAVNGSEHKAPKIRIKVNSNKSLPRNTAAIYSGLGLDISPSSSTEDNLDETAGALVPEVLPDESPRTIFEVKFYPVRVIVVNPCTVHFFKS